MLIGDILAQAAARDPDKPALVMGPLTRSYRELDGVADRVAAALVRDGLGRERNVAIYSVNHIDYPAVYFGAARAGAVLAHLSARFTPGELERVVAGTDIEAVFVHPDLLDNLLAVRDRLPDLRALVVLGAASGPGTVSLEEFLGPQPAAPPAVDVDPGDPFAITFTGGTTGFPRGVMVSHASRVIGSVRAAREYGMRDDDVLLCSTPLFHIAGLFVWFQTGILMGCTCVLLPAWDPEAFMDLVEQGEVTAAFLVPTQISGVINHPRFSPERLARWRYCNFAGAPNPVAQLERMLEILPGVIWVEQYGQSEAGNLTVRPPEYNRTKPGSVGRAFRDLDLAVFDGEDRPLPPGVPGEVVTRGVHVMGGYYRDPEQTQAVMTRDGWLRTGDVGYLDEDGFLYLVDRSKDVIISGGENVYPAEIENVLYEHAGVEECAVFGIPDDHWGELPAAHVVLKPGAEVTADELIDFCAERAGRYKRPRRVEIVAELPKTAVGKIQRNVIRDTYWTDRERRI